MARKQREEMYERYLLQWLGRHEEYMDNLEYQFEL